MDLLRWILLGVGILIVIGVYVWSQRREQAAADPFVRTEPGVGHDDDSNDPLFAPTPRASFIPPLTTSAGEPDLQAVHRELSSLQDLLKHESHETNSAAQPRYSVVDEGMPASLRNPADKSPASPPEEKLVVLYLVAHPNQVFTASLIGESLRDLDLEYGEMHIYHRYPDEPDNTVPIFGVANLVEPGTLEPEALAETGTPGLTLFLQLPGPLRPVQAFDMFVTAAQQLTRHLDGELRDNNRHVLSRQLLEHLRDDVQQYERRLRLSQA